jgi:hypothetical protein
VLGVPWIAGDAVRLALGERDRAELGCVRDAEEDEAGVHEPFDDEIGLGRHRTARGS